MRRETRCTSWFCVADTAFQYEVSQPFLYFSIPHNTGLMLHDICLLFLNFLIVRRMDCPFYSFDLKHIQISNISLAKTPFHL